MKRKLSAIIALVLAVVMVFPTAIFVGAANVAAPAGEVIKATVSGGIVAATGRLEGTKEYTTNGAITLALTGDAAGSLTLPKDYSNLQVVKTTDNGAAFLTLEGTNFTVEAADDFARSTHSDTFKFTATKTVKDEKTKKETTYEATFTLTVNVVEKKIIDVILYGSSDSDWFAGKKSVKLTGAEEYNATNSLTIDKIDVLYNSDKGVYVENVPVNEQNLLLSIQNTNPDAAASVRTNRELKCGTTMKLLGDDVKLSYTYTDSANISKSGEIDLHVTTSSVQYVKVHGTVLTIITEEEITESNFLSAIEAEVKLKEHSSSLWYSGEQVKNKADGKFSITYYEDSQYKAELSAADIANYKKFKEAFFVVQYEDAFWYSGSTRIKDFFTLQEIEPKKVEIDWDGAEKTEYYEGYVIGTDARDWDGVIVTVTYENGEKIVYNTIDGIETLNLILSPIVAREKYVTIESILGYDMGIASNLPTGFTLLYREVMSMTINAGAQKYKDGDKLDLSGIKATLKYNYGENDTRSITNDEFTCSPKNGTTLTADIDEVLVVYKDPNTGKEVSASFPITVSAGSGAIKEVVVVSDGAKNEYFIGEPLEKDGYRFFVIYKDNTPSKYVNLADCTGVNVNDVSVYKNNAFQKAFSGSLTLSFKLPASVDAAGTVREVTLNNIKVTKRPLLVSIAASSDKLTYMEGETPKVSDFTITAKYDDGNQRVFKADASITGTQKATYSVKENGVTYTVKLTPATIDSDANTIRVAYTEKVTVGATSTTTRYDDVEIAVEIPDAILTYYSTTDKTYVTEAYEDLYDALEKAKDVTTATVASNRIPQIQLRRDVTMVSDFPTNRSMEIDLNGHTLTMIRGEIYVSSNASVSTKVAFTNSVKTDAKLVYSNDENDTVIIAYNDEYVIDKETDEAGKYTIKITTPKNGKVTGPSEVTHGHDAKFTITPNEGYMIGTIKINNKNSAVPADGKLIIENVQENLTITVTFAEKAWDNPFTDVYKSATYYKSIQFVYENGLFTGMSATKFEPDTTMTRAMFVTVLGRLAGIDADAAEDLYGYNSEFTDVASNDQSIRYAIPYIEWASENGLIEGYGNGKFGPKDNITHAQMYVLMERYANYIERLNTNASGVNIAANDTKDIPDWAYESVEYAAKKSYLITSSNRLTPNANAKRSELAMLLDKFCTNVLDK